MNYRRICLTENFLVLWYLGIVVDHNSHNLFLGIAAALSGYFMAKVLFKGKLARILFLVPISVVICQFSITAKKAVMDEGFKQVLAEKPVGAFVADFLYGLKCTVETAYGAFGAVGEALANDQYAGVESLNYRFVAVAVAIVILTVFLLKERREVKAEEA